MKVYDEKGLKAALESLDAPPQVPTPPRWGSRFRAVGLALSTMVALGAGFLHFASFVTVFEHANAFIVALALSSLGCFGAMLAASGFGKKTRKLALTRYPRAGDVVMSAMNENIAAVKKVPSVAIAGFVVLAFYFGISFLLFLTAAMEGSPVERNGELQLQNHGRFIRTLDRAEFEHREALEVRGMSGHFVMFSLAAAMGFAYLVDKPERSAG
jgi:hypothetical protein